MKVKFLTDYSPRKKGEVVEFLTRDELRTAEFYLANNIAVRCKCSEAPEGCPDCAKKLTEANLDLKSFKKAELISHALLLAIDLNGSETKADLIALIESK